MWHYFAINALQVFRILPGLLANCSLRRSWLVVEVQTIAPSVKRFWKVQLHECVSTGCACCWPIGPVLLIMISSFASETMSGFGFWGFAGDNFNLRNFHSHCDTQNWAIRGTGGMCVWHWRCCTQRWLNMGNSFDKFCPAIFSNPTPWSLCSTIVGWGKSSQCRWGNIGLKHGATITRFCNCVWRICNSENRTHETWLEQLCQFSNYSDQSTNPTYLVDGTRDISEALSCITFKNGFVPYGIHPVKPTCYHFSVGFSHDPAMH